MSCLPALRSRFHDLQLLAFDNRTGAIKPGRFDRRPESTFHDIAHLENKVERTKYQSCGFALFNAVGEHL